jgi:hypothetical protein
MDEQKGCRPWESRPATEMTIRKTEQLRRLFKNGLVDLEAGNPRGKCAA